MELRANAPDRQDFYLISKKSWLPISMIGNIENVISSPAEDWWLTTIYCTTVLSKTKAGFPLRPYRTETYWWACADWKEVYKSTYFRVYSRIKIKSSSQVNFLAYYGSTNQSTFTKFWNLKTFSLRYGTGEVENRFKFHSTISIYMQYP
jgi:hypothetical protein